MLYLNSLNKCADTLEECNRILQQTTSSLNSLCKTFPRVETAISCEKRYELTTMKDIDKAQDLISTEAIPFLYRQVEQLEEAIQLISSRHDDLNREVAHQKGAYMEFLEREKESLASQSLLRRIKTDIGEAQELLMELKTKSNSKQKQMNDLIKRIQAQSSNSSSELEKLDLEIEEAKISLRRKKREIASVPDEPDILFRSEECDAFDTIEALREILNLVEKGGLDKDASNVLGSSIKGLDYIEANYLTPVWDEMIELQPPRLHYMSKLLKYLFGEEGAVMHHVVEQLIESPERSMTTEQLIKSFGENEVMARRHLSSALTNLRKLGITKTWFDDNGKQENMTVYLNNE